MIELFFCLGGTDRRARRLGQEANHTAAGTSDTATVIVRAQWLIDGTATSRANNNGDRDSRQPNHRCPPAKTQALPAAAQVIDLGTATVAAGLIDAHTHIFCGRGSGGRWVRWQLLKYPPLTRCARRRIGLARAEQGLHQHS